MEKQKLIHMEALRIWAIYWVMFVHTGQNGFYLFSIAQGSPLYGAYLFLSIACKAFASPLFYMISGALLLKKEESIGIIYKKRFLKMLIILIVTSIFYVVYDFTKTGRPLELIAFFKTIYNTQQRVHLWFLYSYLGILMMLPLLKKLARNLTLKEYVYLAGMSLLFVGIIPILEYRLSLGAFTINSNIRGAFFTSTGIVFFMMGYFFEYVLPEKYYTLKNAFIGLLLSLLCIGISSYMTDFRAGITGDWSEGGSQVYHNIFRAIPTYTAYFICKLIFMKRQISQNIQKIIYLIGSTTFGIYLLEAVLRPETFIIFTTLKPFIRTMPACLIWIAAAFLLGFFITLILKKIPIISMYI